MTRQLKPTSAQGNGRQRMLKPLAAVHGHSPLRLKVSIEDFENSEPRRSPRKLAPSTQAESIRHSSSDDDDRGESDEDKENVNPQRSVTANVQFRPRQTKTPLAEIILIEDFDQDSDLGSTGKIENHSTSDSEFHVIDNTDDNDSDADLPGRRRATRSVSPSKRRLSQSEWNSNDNHGNKNVLSPHQDLEGGDFLDTCGTDITGHLAALVLEPPHQPSSKRQGTQTTTGTSYRVTNTETPPQTPSKKSVPSRETEPSPTKSRLNSPSKATRKDNVDRRIPPTPHRQSIDAFWAQDVVDSWNDEYSPTKVVGSPRKTALQRMLAEIEGWSSSEDEGEKKLTNPNPTLSPFSESKQGRSTGSGIGQSQPSPGHNKSPSKRMIAQQNRDRKAAGKAAKEEFLISREATSRDFLKELDDKITDGRIAALTAETGGVKIVWSVTLRSTAGRANWRREAVHRTQPKTLLNGSSLNAEASTTTHDSCHMPTVTHRHVAHIELATKVITTKDRLLNVVAHEFCHLANFMISNVKDQPHGKSFKTWASKVTREFADRGVMVTTKHDWEVEYKYEWACVGRPQKLNEDRDIEALMQQLTLERAELNMDDGGCGTLYQRHSKSIDPSKHGCGKCKGKLIQIKPAPRRRKDT